MTPIYGPVESYWQGITHLMQDVCILNRMAKAQRGKKRNRKQVSPAHVLLTPSPPQDINLPSSPIQQQEQVEEIVTHSPQQGLRD